MRCVFLRRSTNLKTIRNRKGFNIESEPYTELAQLPAASHSSCFKRAVNIFFPGTSARYAHMR